VTERDWTMDDVDTLIEIRGVYDGWSAALLKDGRYVNRWDPERHPQRWKLTDEYLKGTEILEERHIPPAGDAR
jgi:hypothetical protein